MYPVSRSGTEILEITKSDLVAVLLEGGVSRILKSAENDFIILRPGDLSADPDDPNKTSVRTVCSYNSDLICSFFLYKIHLFLYPALGSSFINNLISELTEPISSLLILVNNIVTTASHVTCTK
jgi:hypothetical protein